VVFSNGTMFSVSDKSHSVNEHTQQINEVIKLHILGCGAGLGNCECVGKAHCIKMQNCDYCYFKLAARRQRVSSSGRQSERAAFSLTH